MRKVILISGASSGIGHQAAIDLIEAGHIVYCAARRVERMENLQRSGGRILEMDVTNPAQVESGFNTMIDEQGRIDVLINNAGVAIYGSAEEFDLNNAQYLFDVNLFGMSRLTQLALPHMRRQKSGKIINMSSGAGKTHTPMGSFYHASKHAIEGWSDCLRVEVEKFGIDVSIMQLGLVQTEMVNAVADTLGSSSEDGPYAPVARRFQEIMREAYTSPNGTSSPKLISKAICRIVDSDKPKTRYVVGKNARLILFLRKWLSDRMYDTFMIKTFG